MQNTVTTPILQANTSNFESIMNETTNQHFPKTYDAIAEEKQRLGFTMPSDVQTCALLRTLSTSKPVGNFLELGTGSGLATAWLLACMDKQSTLVFFAHVDEVLAHARNNPGPHNSLSLVHS